MNYIKRFVFFILCSATNLTAAIPDLDTILSVLSRLPDWDASQFSINKVAEGFTNHNYILTIGDKRYFVHVGSDAPDLLELNSDREYACSNAAATLGLAPKVALYDDVNHILVFTFIPHQSFDLQNPERLSQAVGLLKQLHQAHQSCPFIFDPYRNLEDYAERVKNLKTHIPFVETWLPIVNQIQQLLPCPPLCLCHLDLTPPNFLYDGNRMWLIDWEYSAMSYPLYDLATFVSEAPLTSDQIWNLLSLYFEKPAQKEFAAVYLLSILVDIRWSLWSCIQEEVSTVATHDSYTHIKEFFFQQAFEKINNKLYHESITILESKTSDQFP